MATTLFTTPGLIQPKAGYHSSRHAALLEGNINYIGKPLKFGAGVAKDLIWRVIGFQKAIYQFWHFVIAAAAAEFPGKIMHTYSVTMSSGNLSRYLMTSCHFEINQVMPIIKLHGNTVSEQLVVQVLALASLAQVLVRVQLAHSVQVEMKSVTSM